ncbi:MULTISPECIES: hypothetical protein [Xenorhabdus]|uniref:hypothetical protein n=1 Tax=Xenorhabdus TaxID=626 RepID=UPI001E3AC01C|nr:hypothetical protein [Xenorhabdus sp. PB30.3]MCC8378713.1 hypothetical protein [Xenorhabdus sp. PB30.3]
MKELNQKEMEQVAGAGVSAKEIAEGIVGIGEKIGEGIIGALEKFGVISEETGEHIKGAMKKGAEFVDSIIDVI